MNTVETLKAARALIEDESRWCQGDYAMLNGVPVWAALNYTDDVDFCRYVDDSGAQVCALGALAFAAGSHDPEKAIPAEDYLTLAANEEGLLDVVDVNDNLGHAAVLRMYDLAIEMAEEESTP